MPTQLLLHSRKGPIETPSLGAHGKVQHPLFPSLGLTGGESRAFHSNSVASHIPLMASASPTLSFHSHELGLLPTHLAE